eukprot:1239077-Pleurochrysis_carterae.AAC.2
MAVQNGKMRVEIGALGDSDLLGTFDPFVNLSGGRSTSQPQKRGRAKVSGEWRAQSGHEKEEMVAQVKELEISSTRGTRAWPARSGGEKSVEPNMTRRRGRGCLIELRNNAARSESRTAWSNEEGRQGRKVCGPSQQVTSDGRTRQEIHAGRVGSRS